MKAIITTYFTDTIAKTIKKTIVAIAKSLFFKDHVLKIGSNKTEIKPNKKANKSNNINSKPPSIPRGDPYQ